MIKDYDFRDFAGAAARAFNTLRFEPDKGLNQALQTIQQQRTANRAKNKTVEYLKGLGTPMGDRLAAMVSTGQLKGSQAYGMIFDMEKEARAAARAASAADLAFDRRVQLAEAGNEFTAGQNLLNRESRAEQNLLNRDATAEQNLLNRDATAEQNELRRQAEIKAASDLRNFQSNQDTREFNRSLKKSEFEAKLKAKYPQSDTSAFSAKFSRYKKAYPDLSDAEVLEKMNDNKYGLSSGVYTSDLARGMRVSKAIRAGITFVNTYRLISPSAPFGGIKDSGYGKEAGIESIKDYTRVKTTWFYTSDEPSLDPFSMR